MSQSKTTQAALHKKLGAFGSLFAALCVVMEPMMAFCLALVAYVVLASV